MKTIQEQLAEKTKNADPQPVQYIGTVEAYDKWAEVCLHHHLHHGAAYLWAKN